MTGRTIIGIDPHQDSRTVVAVDECGNKIAALRAR